MRINRVYIDAFGKLSRFEHSFSDGFNLVYGDNEYGKTTLMAFIKMMFYGTPNNAAGRAEREHYMPWSGEKCAGYIDFELNGNEFRLTREFAPTNSGDRITLEKSGGRPEKISPRDSLGERIFGCSLECFERSLFIGSLNDAVTGKEALGEINNRLSNLVSTGDEDTSAKLVTDRLTKAKHTFMSKGGRIGIYDKGAARLATLKNDLIEIREKYAGKSVLEDRISQLKTELTAKKEKLKTLSSAFEQSEKITRALKLRELIAAANDLDRKAQQITCKNGELLSNAHIDSLRSNKLELKSIEDSIGDLQREIEKIQEVTANEGASDSAPEKVQLTQQIMSLEEQLGILDAEISTAEAESEAAAQHGFKVSGGAMPIVLGVVGALLIACAVGTYFLFGTVPLAIFGILGIACTAISVYLQSTAKKRAQALREGFLTAREELVTKKAKRQELKNNIDALERQREQISALEQNAVAATNARQQLVLQKREELSRLETKLASKKAELEELTEFLPDRDADILADRLRVYSTCAATLAYICETAGCDVTCAKAELEEIGELPKDIPEVGALRTQISEAQNQVSATESEILRLDSQIKTMYSALPVPAELEREISLLSATLEGQKSFCDSIDIALEVLEQAGEELHKTWGSELNDKVKEIFSLLTDGRYTETYVTKELQLTAVQEDSYIKRFVEHLSAGTRDQAYFSLRLAVCELLFDDAGSMPVFLDDVFERYDDTRARRGIEFLRKYSDNRQVIFFTCHDTFTKM